MPKTEHRIQDVASSAGHRGTMTALAILDRLLLVQELCKERQHLNLMVVCLFVFSPVADLSNLVEEAGKPLVSLQSEEKPKGLDLLGTFKTSVRVSGMLSGFVLIVWGGDSLDSGFKN